jgi:hypothetical protein
MGCSLRVQAGALPGLSATDALGVAAAGDTWERAVSHFRSEKQSWLEPKGRSAWKCTGVLATTDGHGLAQGWVQAIV